MAPSSYPEKRPVIGMLGTGQLGRMAAMAAAKLGIEVVVYGPDAETSPAGQVCKKTYTADYDDLDMLQAFVADVDVVTYEFENIPVHTLRIIDQAKPVFPSPGVIEIAQNRINEKSFLNKAGIRTAEWAPCASADDIRQTLDAWNTDTCIVKTNRFGYDGKGQVKITAGSDIDADFAALKTDSAIIESIVPFEHEISVIVCRDQSKTVDCYAPGLNVHRNHILHTTTAPAPLSKDILDKAVDIAKTIAQEIDLVGVLGVELFVTAEGEILANELAPRPHNSGHWTMDACVCSQFEQQIRAVAGIPLGSCDHHHEAVMLNILGDNLDDLEITTSNTSPHYYGKAEARHGRKMGHVTTLKTKSGS